jgi:hypothetical protein
MNPKERAAQLVTNWLIGTGSAASLIPLAEAAIAAAVLAERDDCRALLIEMASADGVDWFTGEALREAAKRLGFRRGQGGSE